MHKKTNRVKTLTSKEIKVVSGGKNTQKYPEEIIKQRRLEIWEKAMEKERHGKSKPSSPMFPYDMDPRPDPKHPGRFIMLARTSVSYTVLRNIIKHCSTTYKELGNNIGIARSNLIKWANGKHCSLSLPNIKKIAKYLDISVDQLLGKKKINFSKLPKKIATVS